MSQHSEFEVQDHPEEEIVEDTIDTGDVDAADDSGDSTGDSPPPQVDSEARLKRLQDRLARQGRELRRVQEDSRRQVAEISAAAQRELDALRQQVGSLGNHLTTQQQQSREAYLATLPPEQRALEEIVELKRMLAGKGQPSPQQAPRRTAPQVDPETVRQRRIEYAQQRSDEILDDLADELGVDLREHFNVGDDSSPIDWTNEATFTATARAAARIIAQGGTVAGSKKTPEKAAASRPLSPRPSAAPAKRKTPPTMEEFQTTLSGYNSKLGPKAMRKELEKMGA